MPDNTIALTDAGTLAYREWAASVQAAGGIVTRLPSGPYKGQIAVRWPIATFDWETFSPDATTADGQWGYQLAPSGIRLQDNARQTVDAGTIATGLMPDNTIALTDAGTLAYREWAASVQAAGGIVTRLPSGPYKGQIAVRWPIATFDWETFSPDATTADGQWGYQLAPSGIRLQDNARQTVDAGTIATGLAVGGIGDALTGGLKTAIFAGVGGLVLFSILSRRR